MADRVRRRARPLLGTRVAIQVRGDQPLGASDAAIDAGFAAIADVQRRLSRFDDTSLLSRINREARRRVVELDDDSAELIAAALDFARDSDGAFDPTAAAAPRRPFSAGKTGTGDERHAGWRAVELDLCRRTIRLHAAVRLDLGGIAKGHAVDHAVAALLAEGVTAGLVEAGGDLRAFGPCEWTVALRDPRPGLGACVTRVPLREAAIASSAMTFAEGRAHLVDRDKRRATTADGVAVQAPTARTADALTKVALFAPPALAETLLRRHTAAALRFLAPADRPATPRIAEVVAC